MADELAIMELKESLKKLEEGQKRIEDKLDKLLSNADPQRLRQLFDGGE